MMQTFIRGREFSGVFTGTLDIRLSDGQSGGGTAGRDMIVVDKYAPNITSFAVQTGHFRPEQHMIVENQILDVETPEPPGGWNSEPLQMEVPERPSDALRLSFQLGVQYREGDSMEGDAI